MINVLRTFLRSSNLFNVLRIGQAVLPRAIRYAHRARIAPAYATHLRQNRMTSRHSLFSSSANRVNVLPNCCECSRYSQHTPRNTNHLHAEVIVFLTNLPICRFKDLC